MKKSEVQTHSDNGYNPHPAVNVKHHLWLPDLFRKYEGTGEHEFSDDAGFWAWLHEVDDRSDWNVMDAADEWARETCWEDLTDEAHEIWPQYSTEMVAEKRHGKFTGDQVPRKRYHVQVYSEGRSGGWCVVHGLPDIEEWDAIALGRWARFEKYARAIAHDEYPYQFIWNLHEHVWEGVREERQNLYPAPNYAGATA